MTFRRRLEQLTAQNLQPSPFQLVKIFNLYQQLLDDLAVFSSPDVIDRELKVRGRPILLLM